MEKGKRLEAEFQLPEAIIQHIQSFLNAKEAAQSTLLSKSWYTSWLTRPNLNFDQQHFVKKSDKDTESSANRLWTFVNNILQRYDKLNLKVDSLRLWVLDYSIVNELIVKALEMGATSLDFKIYGGDDSFTLPHQVFGSENLITLSVSGCKIGIGVDRKVSCSKLKSLTLDNVYAKGDTIWDIIMSCFLIEKLSLSRCTAFYETAIPTTSSVVNEFHKLKHLLLSSIDVSSLFPHDFSSKFPFLKDLVLHDCHHCDGIQISSHSLEYINITKDSIFSMKFDVPNIRKFTFSGSIFPWVSFNTTASTWESHISIKNGASAPNANWFLQLNVLLKALSLSKVSLSLEDFPEKVLYCEGNIYSLPKPEVENLTISGPCSVCPDLFYSLFQCCCPIYITQYWFPNSDGGGKKIKDFREFYYNRMMLQVSLHSCIAYQRTSGGCDLDEVSVESYDEALSAWRPRLLDASASEGADGQKNRLHLRWGC